MRKKTQTLEALANPKPQINGDQENSTDSCKISLYEQSRDQRIKENLERMQKLGIVGLSLHLKSLTPVNRRRKRVSDPDESQGPSPVLPSEPVRRSSRLQNATPVSYSEGCVAKKDRPLEDPEILLEKGSKVEIYIEEHEKLLGNTEMSWELFVDGCGTDGRRIYDPLKGKTCHQCRQKTLGHRTQCSRCNMVQGQFCGDCLYMRYGEHVLEAKENPNWLCPVCRGICNCSLCRQAKGWPPTGALYRKITKLGFKSVAHYLIQTRRSQTNLGKDQETINQTSVKRSLPFKDMEAVPKESLDINDEIIGSEDKLDNELRKNQYTISQVSVKRSLPFSDMEAPPMESLEINEEKVVSECKTEEKSKNQLEGECMNMEFSAINDLGLLNRECEKKRDAEFEAEKENEQHSGNAELLVTDHLGLLKDEPVFQIEKEKELNDMEKEQSHRNIAEFEVENKNKLHSGNAELPVTDHFGLPKVNPEFEVEKDKEPEAMDIEELSHRNVTEFEIEKENKLNSRNVKLSEADHFGLPKDASEFEVKKERELNPMDKGPSERNIAMESSTKRKYKRAHAIEPSNESTAGRLSQRRRKGDGHDEFPGENEAINSGKEEHFVKNKDGDNDSASKNSSKLRKKCAIITEPSPDSIAGRLRQRRRENQ